MDSTFSGRCLLAKKVFFFSSEAYIIIHYDKNSVSEVEP